MHPELRRARGLYHEWRYLPDADCARLAPLAREVKELALDLRGCADAGAAEMELAQANAVLESALERIALARAA